MANTQLENGYTPIANEILDALIRLRVPGEARQVLDVVIRKTYGYHKSTDRISLSRFSLLTGLKKTTVCKALAKLQQMNLITKKGNDGATLYKFNKDFDRWKPLPERGIVARKGSLNVTHLGTDKRTSTTVLTEDRAETPSTIFTDFITNPKPIIPKLVDEYEIDEDTATKQVYAFMEYWTEP